MQACFRTFPAFSTISERAMEQIVCRLVTRDGSGAMTGGGTGFHYGNGWIITNSHVVRKDEKDECASNLSKLWVEFLDRDRLPPQERLCFFVKIRSGSAADFDNPDVAIFHLTDDEMKILQHNLSLPATTDFPLGMIPNIFKIPADSPTPPPEIGAETICFHYGWIDNEPPPDQAHVANHERTSNVYPEGTHFIRTRVNTCKGSSGAPVFYASTGRLIGVHFAGDGTRASAISFPRIVYPFVNKLISGIAETRLLLDYVSLSRKATDLHFSKKIFDQACRMLEAIRFAPYAVKVTSGDPGVDLLIRQVMLDTSINCCRELILISGRKWGFRIEVSTFSLHR